MQNRLSIQNVGYTRLQGRQDESVWTHANISVMEARAESASDRSYCERNYFIVSSPQAQTAAILGAIGIYPDIGDSVLIPLNAGGWLIYADEVCTRCYDRV